MTLPLFDATPTRADQLFARFKTFHRDNPAIWNLFCRFAFEVLNTGRTRYSADAILHRIRWHVDIETKGDSSLRLNNDLASYYSRLFAVAYPKHADLFEQRRRTSADRPSYDSNLAIVPTGSPEGEAQLIYELTELAHLSTPEFHRP